MSASLLAGFVMIHSDSCESLNNSFKSDAFASFQKHQITLTGFKTYRDRSNIFPAPDNIRVHEFECVCLQCCRLSLYAWYGAK